MRIGATVEDEAPLVRLSLTLTSEQMERIRGVAVARRTPTSAAMRWLLEKGLDWYEGLPRDERERL